MSQSTTGNVMPHWRNQHLLNKLYDDTNFKIGVERSQIQNKCCCWHAARKAIENCGILTNYIPGQLKPEITILDNLILNVLSLYVVDPKDYMPIKCEDCHQFDFI